MIINKIVLIIQMINLNKTNMNNINNNKDNNKINKILYNMNLKMNHMMNIQIILIIT